MRINFFGGPCAGKSRTAASIYSQLKDRHLSIELVQEFVKPAAYRGDKFHQFDQVHILGQQLHAEYQYLTAGVKNIVTDSPALLSVVYCKNLELRDAFNRIYWQYDLEHPSINIFLERQDKHYQTEGRFQTLEEAKQIDDEIKDVLNRHGYSFVSFPYHAQPAILDHVLAKVDK